MIKFVVTILLISTVICKRDVKSKRPHIAGGMNATKHQFPFLVQLRLVRPFNRQGISTYSREGICGASLVSSQWIVTAAHCFKDVMDNIEYLTYNNHLEVYMGTNIRLDPNAYINFIFAVYLHPEYHYLDDISGNLKEIKNDVAVARLKRAFSLGKYVQTIYLAPTIKNFARWIKHCSPGTVIGIGILNFEEDSPYYVMYARVEIKNPYERSSMSPFLREETLIITLSKTLKGHIMRGDSGGPFVCYHNREAVLYGINSAIVGNVNVTAGVYERIDKHLDFITKYVPGAIIY